MNLSSISIVMSVFNGQSFVEKAIKSILNQTYSSFEFIIVDDGSTDNTSLILKRFEKIDDRIKLLSNKTNKGLSYSLNLGVKAAKFSYIARMDADDISHPSRLENQINYLMKNQRLKLLATSFTLNQKPLVLNWGLDRVSIGWRFLFNNAFCHSSVMYCKKSFIALGGYSLRYKYAQDYDLFSRFYEKYQVETLPEALIDRLVKEDDPKAKSQQVFADEIAKNNWSALGVEVSKSQIKEIRKWYNSEFKKLDEDSFSQIHQIFIRYWHDKPKNNYFKKLLISWYRKVILNTVETLSSFRKKVFEYLSIYLSEEELYHFSYLLRKDNATIQAKEVYEFIVTKKINSEKIKGLSYYQLGVFYFNMGDLMTALDHYNLSLKHVPDHEASRSARLVIQSILN